jgi:hypothetical protein
MNAWAKWTARTVLVTTGLAVAGGGLTGVALAGTAGTNTNNSSDNTGNVSVLGGNRVTAPVSIPIDICGNAAAILGIAMAGCQGGASVAAAHPGAGSASASGTPGPSLGNIAVGHGTVVKVPVEIAADACGNTVGNATASCHGGVSLPVTGAALQRAPQGGSTPQQASLQAGNLSVGSGNQVQAPVSVPVDVCGNAVAVLGDSSAGCAGGATVGDQAGAVARSLAGDAMGGARHPAAHRPAKPHRNAKKLMTERSAAKLPKTHPTMTELAGLGALPGVGSLPALGGLAGLPVLKGLTGGGALLPVSSLAALQERAGQGGMSSNSFATLAVGALLAGAAALKLASRRPRARKAAAGEVRA